MTRRRSVGLAFGQWGAFFMKDKNLRDIVGRATLAIRGALVLAKRESQKKLLLLE